MRPRQGGRDRTLTLFQRGRLSLSQQVLAGHGVRRTRKGREVLKPLWSRIAPALQLPAVFQSAVGCRLRRTEQGGIQIRCAIAVLG